MTVLITSTKAQHVSYQINTAAFSGKGTFYPISSKGHVATCFKTIDLELHRQLLELNFAKIKRNSTLPPAIEGTIYHYLKKIEIKIDNLEQMTHHEAHTRTKKQVLLAIGSFISGLIGSIFISQQEIQSLHNKVMTQQENQKHILEIIAHEETKIDELSKATNKLIGRTYQETRTAAAATALLFALKELDTTVDTTMKTFEMAMMGHASAPAISRKRITQALDKIQLKAQTHNLNILIGTTEHFFELQTTWFKTQNGFCTITEVPLVNKQYIFDLFTHIGVPIIKNKTLFYPIAEQLLVGKSQHHEGLIYLDPNLAGCTQLLETWTCPRPTIIYKGPPHTCIGALLTDQTLVSTNCAFKVEHNKPFIKHIQGTRYMAYAPEQQKITISCPQATDQTINIEGSHTFVIEKSCTATSESWTVTATEETDRELELFVNASFSDLLSVFSQATGSNQMAFLNITNDLKEIRQLQTNLELNSTTSWHSAGLTSIGTLFLFICGALAAWKLRHKCHQKPSEQLNEVVQDNQGNSRHPTVSPV